MARGDHLTHEMRVRGARHGGRVRAAQIRQQAIERIAPRLRDWVVGNERLFLRVDEQTEVVHLLARAYLLGLHVARGTVSRADREA